VETSWKNDANGANVGLTVTPGLAFLKSSMTFCQPACAVAGNATFRVPELVPFAAVSLLSPPPHAVTPTATAASASAAARLPGRAMARIRLTDRSRRISLPRCLSHLARRRLSVSETITYRI
jgi:hypothetical protein